MIALIVGEVWEHKTKEFNDEGNFHMNTIYDLIQSGYTIVECRPRNADELKTVIEAQEDGSIWIIIVRAHGTPKSIELMKGWKLTPENVPEIFALLRWKAAPGMLIMLNSCSTGKFAYKIGEFGKKEECIDMDNMAMAFAKTAGGDTRVIAPTVDEYMGGMMRVGTEWKFMSFGHPAMYNDISACFGPDGPIDRTPLLYDSSAVARIRRTVVVEQWNTADIIVKIIIRHRDLVEPMAQVRTLLSLLAPEQMFDGMEHVYMNIEQELDPEQVVDDEAIEQELDPEQVVDDEAIEQKLDPEQVVDGKKHVYVDIEQEFTPFQCSIIIKCLSEATISLREGFLVWLWLPLAIQQWAAEHGCADYVNGVIYAFRHSRLGRALVRK